MRRTARGNRSRRPACLAGGGGHIGSGEGQDAGGLSGMCRKREPPRDGEIGMCGIGIADDDGECTGFQRLLHGPQQCLRLLQRDGDEACTRQAQPFQSMAIEPTVLALLFRKAAPQQRAALLRIGQAAERQCECKTHGGWRIAIGAWRHVMQARLHEPLRWQMTVEFGQSHHPRCMARPGRPVELRLCLLNARDVAAQGLDQGREILALPKGGNGGTSAPVPHTMCRFHRHDCNIQNVPILFHRTHEESR